MPAVAGRTRRSALGADAYTIGAMVGATLVLGSVWLAISGLLQPISIEIRSALLLPFIVFLVARDVVGVPVPIPQRKAQIPQHVPSKPFPIGHLQFGFEMGTGLRTYLPTAAPHVLLLAVILLSPDLASFAAAALAFGIGRSLILWIAFVVGPSFRTQCIGDVQAGPRLKAAQLGSVGISAGAAAVLVLLSI